MFFGKLLFSDKRCIIKVNKVKILCQCRITAQNSVFNFFCYFLCVL